MERHTVVEAIQYLVQDLDEEGLLGDAALLLLSDVTDYLALSKQEKETALGYMNCKAIEQWQSEKIVLLKDRETVAGIVQESTTVSHSS